MHTNQRLPTISPTHARKRTIHHIPSELTDPISQALITDLRGTSTEAFWVGTSYMLACAVCMPWLAAVSDIFGRPLLVMASMIAFTAGTIICAVAQTPAVLLVGRVIQGTGGGGIIILSLVVFTDIVPLRYRPKWYGIV